MTRFWATTAGLSGAMAVAVGAWASHGLARTFPPDLLERAVTQAQSATHLHLAHSVVLLVTALWMSARPSRWLRIAAILFLAGIVCFSVGIYVLHLWWPRLGAGGLRYIVPTGGVAFILGWLALAVAAARSGTGGTT